MGTWRTNFMTIKPLPPLPRLIQVSAEERESPSYHWDGRLRDDNIHCCFQYTLSGEGVFEDAAGKHRLPPGNGFLCQISDPATSYYYPHDGEGLWKFVFITFDGEMATELVRSMAERYGHLFRLDINGPVVRRLLSWRAYDGALLRISPHEGASIVLELLNSLGSGMESKHWEKAPSSRLVAKACGIFDSRFASDISVAKVAKELDVTQAHLTRVFKSELNCAPHQYLSKRRLFAACKLLRGSTLNSKDICGRIGGMTPQHFVRLFKKEFAITPERYRKAGLANPLRCSSEID